LLHASGVGARVHAARIPIAPELTARLPGEALALACSAGDDYELVFTLPPLCATEVNELAAQGGVALRCIGEVVAGAELLLLDEAGKALPLGRRGFDHFHSGE
jgi:thiamine-monophosphate kinase